MGLVFEDESASDDLRLLVLDLLAGAGTFEAQVVIRRLLALAVARRESRRFATYVQRLGSVERPDGPTLRFLMSVYAESRAEPSDVRASCAYALGTAVGQAFAAGDGEVAVRASDVLRRDLLRAATSAEKCGLVTALGSAGLVNDELVILRFTSDTDPHVRASAALALRKITTSDGRAALLTMLADDDSRVSQNALIALSEQQLSDAELERLAELVNAGRTQRVLDGGLLRLFVAQRLHPSAAAGRVTAIEGALRLLIGRVEGVSVREGFGSGERLAVPAATGRPLATATLASGPRPAMDRQPATERRPTSEPRRAPEPRPLPAQSPGAHVAEKDISATRDRPDSPEVLRRRLEELGLNPNRTPILPPPSPRHVVGSSPPPPTRPSPDPAIIVRRR